MIRYFIRNGIAVSVLSMALLLFGVLALFSLPIQLTPDVSAPVISVVTYYPGATPEDIEQDILIDQEQYLKSLPGLEKMISTASMGQAEVELEFGLETNQQENIVRINNALAQVPGYPENVDEPTIQTSRASEQPVAWISVRTRPEHPEPLDVQEMFDYVEDHVKPYFERLTGISSVRGVYGGTERQMQVMIDPTKLADRGIAISRVREAIRSRNRDVSGGDLDEGKRRFNVRTVGRYESTADIEDTIIDVQDGTPVYLRDVGYARLGHAEKRTLIRQNTEPALAFGPQRKRGTNLLVVMEQVQGAIRELNDGVLREKGIYLTRVTDSTSYVRDAVDHGAVQPAFRRHAGPRYPADLPAPRPFHPDRRPGDPAVRHRFLLHDQRVRTFHQRHLTGRSRLLHRRRPRRLDRRSGKHLPAPLHGQVVL